MTETKVLPRHVMCHSPQEFYNVLEAGGIPNICFISPVDIRKEGIVIVASGFCPTLYVYSNATIITKPNSNATIEVYQEASPWIKYYGHVKGVLHAFEGANPRIETKAHSAPILNFYEDSLGMVIIYDASEPTINVCDSADPKINVRRENHYQHKVNYY